MATETKKTIKPSGQGGDYTSLSAWEAGEQQDLVTADKYAVGEIDGSWSSIDSGTVTIDGWETDATRYIEISTTAAARHDGKWKTDAYIKQNSNNDDAILIEEVSVRIIGLQIYMGACNGYDDGIYWDNQCTDDSRVENCIVKASASTSGGSNRAINVYAWTGTSTFHVRNCIVYDLGGNFGVGVRFLGKYGSIANSTCYNCTAIGFDVGFDINTVGSVTANVRIRNCLAQDCDDGYAAAGNGTWDEDSSNNCSDITDDAPGSSPRTGDVTFAGSEDYHLAAGDTIARDYGVNLSGIFTDDIDGQTRSGTWDIGADEYVSGAQTLTAPHLDDGADTFYGPTASKQSPGSLTAPHLDDAADTWYAPTASKQSAGSLTAPHLDDVADTWYAPTASKQSAGSLTVPHLDDGADTFYGPTVQIGGLALIVPWLQDPDRFYAPNVSIEGLAEFPLNFQDPEQTGSSIATQLAGSVLASQRAGSSLQTAIA